MAGLLDIFNMQNDPTQSQGAPDPRLMGLLGAMQGYGNSTAYSRMPVSGGQQAASIIGGMTSGLGQGYQLNNIAQEGQAHALANQRLMDLRGMLKESFPSVFGTQPTGDAPTPNGTPGFSPTAQSPASAGGILNSPGAIGGPPQDSSYSPVFSQPPSPSAPAPSPSASAPTVQMPQAPSALAQPSAPSAQPGLTGQIIKQALLADYITPGAGKEIMAKQFPGPTDAQRALVAAGIDPNSREGQQLLGGAAFNASGVKPYIGGERPGVPLQRFNPATGKYEMESYAPQPIPGQTLVSNGKGGYSYAPVPGADAALDANAAREPNIRAGIEYGGLAGRAPAQNPTGPNPNQAPMLPTKGPGITEPVKSPNGTTIPPLKEQPPIPRDTKSLDTLLPEWSKRSNELVTSLGPAEQAEQRLKTIAEAYKLTPSGSFATNKAQIGAALMGLGIVSRPEDLPAFLGDPAQVQLALHENAVKTLNALKATTSRFTQMEFKTLSQQTEHPNLQPEANLQQIAEDVAMLRQSNSLVKDWPLAQKTGWRDPYGFETAWRNQNPLGPMVTQTLKEIGPLKGMPGAGSYIWTPQGGLQPKGQ